MPVTVPKSPNNGATTAIILTNMIPLVISGDSLSRASPSLSSIDSASDLGLSWKTFRMRPNGLSKEGRLRSFDCLATAAPTPRNANHLTAAIAIAKRPSAIMTYPTMPPSSIFSNTFFCLTSARIMPFPLAPVGSIRNGTTPSSAACKSLERETNDESILRSNAIKPSVLSYTTI